MCLADVWHGRLCIPGLPHQLIAALGGTWAVAAMNWLPQQLLSLPVDLSGFHGIFPTATSHMRTGPILSSSFLVTTHFPLSVPSVFILQASMASPTPTSCTMAASMSLSTFACPSHFFCAFLLCSGFHSLSYSHLTHVANLSLPCSLRLPRHLLLLHYTRGRLFSLRLLFHISFLLPSFCVQASTASPTPT